MGILKFTNIAVDRLLNFKPTEDNIYSLSITSGMKKNYLLTTSAILLVVLGVIMIYLGVKAHMLPPSITGAGFIIIAFAFWGLRSK